MKNQLSPIVEKAYTKFSTIQYLFLKTNEELCEYHTFPKPRN